MQNRRDFLGALTTLGATGALSLASVARAAEQDAHPVDAPEGFELRELVFEKSIMLGRTAKAIAAVPRDLPAGARLPLIVLLPGGIHGKQPPDHGCWGWWSDFRLDRLLTALRRGRIERDDANGLLDAAQLDAMNADLAKAPWRGAVIVTPWVLSRQTNPVPHGAMVTPFLRTLVERARAELPVLADRASTGLGGCSVGGLWSLYCGAQLSDLFSTLVAVQPFTEDLERILRKTIEARAQPQRIRVVTARSDRLRAPALKLAAALKKDGVELELAEYRGDHNNLFPGGPGGLDLLLAFDRGLARQQTEAAPSLAPTPAPSTSASSAPMTSSVDSSAASAPPAPAPEKSRRSLWLAAALSASALAAAAVALRFRKAT